jgi:hydrogenase maturation protein HypF
MNDQPAGTPAVRRVRVRVRGQVQGVGFRPYVYALARHHHLHGWVLNDGAGVLLEAEGTDVSGFLEALPRQAPPLARVDAIEVTGLAPVGASAGAGFAIRASDNGEAVSTAIVPDAAVCPDCLDELFDAADRRYRYPFLNCTRCGPRFTITRRLPYDRAQTAMAPFPMCPACAAEYADPANRRFHAEPTCCPACGPRLSHPVEEAAAALMAGRIVAIKGLGGFHLVCDARDGAAVARLRQAKQRDGKPFAVMVANAAAAATLVALSDPVLTLLESPARPVVLARRLESTKVPDLAGGLAPDLDWLGVMLPYTPLHWLLFHELLGRPAGAGWRTGSGSRPPVLVMTSANPGGEPLAIDDDEAARRLAGIADLIVGHNRAIVVRADDPVVRVVAGAPTVLRRGRGFVPAAISLPWPVPPVLAVGGHLKASVCVTRGAEAFLSQHIGDLDNAATIGFLEEATLHLLDILEVQPVAVAHDLHPDFQSTRFAERLNLPLVPVQHHHAHVAAVMAEHHVVRPTVGLALDGTGLGTDGGNWGGEMLLVDGTACQRLGHLAPLPLPGGDMAARQPWRMATAALVRLGRKAEIVPRFAAFGPADGVRRLVEMEVNAPPTTSCGRWFDAACGLLGVRPLASYEGEAPMVLESLVRTPRIAAGAWRIDGGVLDLLPLLRLLCDTSSAAQGAGLFHGTLAAALVDWALPAVERHSPGRVVLAGGCLMNAVLAERLVAGFAAHKVTALLARHAPTNDGGLSLGQAWVAALTVISGGLPSCALPSQPGSSNCTTTTAPR